MSQRTHTCTSGTWHACLRGPVSLLIAVAVLVGGVSAAQAALTTGGCLAQKRAAWGNLRKCQAVEEGKQLRGKTAALAKCQTKFQDKLGKISAKAAAKVVACRYGDNGNGTVTDYDTGLQWEQKVSPGGGASDPHDVDNTYSWNTAVGGTTPNGTAFTDFLDKLNNCSTSDGSTVTGSFAGHCDWRLPSIAELEAIVDLTASGCGSGSPCIDPIFGSTVAGYYWSATTYADLPYGAWDVFFYYGDVGTDSKDNTLYVRAVRTGL